LQNEISMSAETIYKGIQEFNKDVSQWAYKIASQLRGNAAAKSQKGKGELAAKLRTNIRYDLGEVESIGYQFPRHGVFFQKGVGKGHVMAGGRVVRGIKHGKIIKPIDGTINRQPQDWFNGVLDTQVPQLADIVANHKADEAALNATGMKIN